MDAQQELFTAIKLALEEKGYAVYDGALPPVNTPYPFIYLGDFQQLDTERKNAVTGTVYPMIHVWHNQYTQRGTVSQMLLDIKTVCRTLQRTTNFAWLIRNVNTRIIADKTTKTPLLHGVFEADCLFS
jgi:hypothetical protein